MKKRKLDENWRTRLYQKRSLGSGQWEIRSKMRIREQDFVKKMSMWEGIRAKKSGVGTK